MELPEPHESLIESAPQKPPGSWRGFRARHRRRWVIPFLWFEWLFQWTVYGLSRTTLFPLLEYCGRLSILIAVIFYFLETPERTKMKHYQAWQVINSAQGKGGSGGRIEALRELNDDHVSLLGVDVSDAFLQGVDLHGANLYRGNFDGADMRDANLSGANLGLAEMNSTNLIHASLAGANVSGANFTNTDLEDIDLNGIKNWHSIASIKGASIQGVKNPPDGFMTWAQNHGAITSAPTTRTSTAQR